MIELFSSAWRFVLWWGIGATMLFIGYHQRYEETPMGIAAVLWMGITLCYSIAMYETRQKTKDKVAALENSIEGWRRANTNLQARAASLNYEKQHLVNQLAQKEIDYNELAAENVRLTRELNEANNVAVENANKIVAREFVTDVVEVPDSK